MAKKEKPKHRRSMLPDDLTQSQTFFRSGERICIKSRFVVDRTKGRSAKDSNKGNAYDQKHDGWLYLAHWLFSTNPEDENDFTKPQLKLFMGSLNYWRPSNDGYTPLNVDLDQSWLNADSEEEILAGEGLYLCEMDDEGNPVYGPDGEKIDPDYESKYGVSENSPLGFFIRKSCMDGQFPRELMEEHLDERGMSAKCWEGVRSQYDEIPQEGGKINPKTRKPYTMTVISQVLETGLDVSNYAAAFGGSGTGSAQASSDSDISAEAETGIVEMITAEGGTLARQNILTTLTKQFGAKVGDVLPLVIASSPWMAEESRPWEFDEKTQTASITAE